MDPSGFPDLRDFIDDAALAAEFERRVARISSPAHQLDLERRVQPILASAAREHSDMRARSVERLGRPRCRCSM